MALADVLSAMREMILDAPDEISRGVEREDALRKRFPKLSREEIIDIAKIDPKRFQTYTTSIFESEGGVLAQHFPITFEILKREWPAVYRKPLSRFQLAKSLHACSPWHSTVTTELGGLLVDYLGSEHVAICKRAPELIDTARYELLTLKVKRSLDVCTVPGALTLSEISALPVDQFLALQIRISPALEILRSEFDLVTFARAFYKADRQLGDLRAQVQPSVFAASRDAECAARWTMLGENAAHYLELKNDGMVADFAEEFIKDLPMDCEETAAFQELTKRVATLIGAGAIALVR